MRDEYDNLVDEVKKYLKFQASLSGGIIYLRKNRDANVVPDQQSVTKTQNTIAEPVNMPALEEGRRTAVSYSLFDREEKWMSSQTLEELNSLICSCMKCPLGKTRTNFVFGVGNSAADIVLVGEAPGADEDRQGEPFVGRAGQLLNKILEAVQLKREEVYICNILKCRPPGNREPLPSEVEQCEPYLSKQIEIIKPKIILALGRVAGQVLLRTTEPLSSLRGRIHYFLDVPLMVVYHPAALLRNPNFKRAMWEDMQKFRAYYDNLHK